MLSWRAVGPAVMLGTVVLTGCTSSMPKPARAARCASPHALLRAENSWFTHDVCRSISAREASSPTVNLHGDLHLEQYAVTDVTSGLSDFDAATTGPAELDLAHIALSLRLAVRARGWSITADRIWKRFADGYRRALLDPNYRPGAPSFDARVRASFDRGRSEFLAAVEGLVRALPGEEGRNYREAFETFVADVAQRDESYEPVEFEVIWVRSHGVGIGSRGVRKALLRTRGTSDRSEDDRIFELKELKLTPYPCIPAANATAARVTDAENRFAAAELGSLGVIDINGASFLVREWWPHYRELKLDDTELTADEMGEIAHVIGAQLGRAHPKELGGSELRRALGTFMEDHASSLWHAAGHRANRLASSWRRTGGECAAPAAIPVQADEHGIAGLRYPLETPRLTARRPTKNENDATTRLDIDRSSPWSD